MKLNDAIETYNPMFLKAFLVSATLFLLYSIINLIDMSGFIRDFNILNVSETPRSRFIYAYIAGYFMFVLKVVLALVTLFVLILIIRIVIAALIYIFTAIKKEKQEGGANSIASEMKAAVMNKVESAVKSNMRWLLGFITLKEFAIIFLVIVPIFLFFVVLAYSMFYNQQHILDVDNQESQRIMWTHHNFMMFLISSLFAIAFIYATYLWFKTAFKF